MRSRVVVMVALVAALSACSTSTPSAAPSATAGPTDAVIAALTPFPPERVRDALLHFGFGLEPLTLEQRLEVAVDPADAIRTALANRGIGNPGPNGVGEIAWTQTGFVYLASYAPHDLPGYGGPHPDPSPFPAYLVQVLAPPIPGYPGENTALVIVDARSGAMGTTYHPCVGGLCGSP